MPAKVLIVDDDEQHRTELSKMAASMGYIPETAADGEEALEKLGTSTVDVITTDLMMPRMDGFQLLRTLLERGDLTPAIVLTGFGNMDQAISIVHDLQAFWFLEKPVQPSVLATLLERAIRHRALVQETERLHRQLSYEGYLMDLVGTSPPMRQIYSLIQQVAPSSASVLITGESGTGKEMVASAIHRLSPRADRPFVAINCAAIPESLIESELLGHERGSFTDALERRPGCFDNGIGIDPKYGSSIFGPFRRLHGRDVPGSGLGLAICQRIIEQCGGRIWLESDVGKGSKFYFTIPAVPKSLPQDKKGMANGHPPQKVQA